MKDTFTDRGKGGTELTRRNEINLNIKRQRELIELIIEEKCRHIHNISENPTIEAHL